MSHWCPDAELQMKERKGKGDALRLAVRAPPRRAVGDQTVFRAPRELKAFVLSRITACLCQEEGSGQCLPCWARSCGVPAQSWGRAGAELWWPGCQCREGVTGVCADVSSGPWLCCTASDTARHPEHSTAALCSQHSYSSAYRNPRVKSLL